MEINIFLLLIPESNGIIKIFIKNYKEAYFLLRERKNKKRRYTMEQTEKNKILVLARRAREADDAENAKKYYEQLLLDNPNDWEAVFYAQYYTFFSSKVIHAHIQADLMRKAAKNSINVICDSSMLMDEKVAAVKVLEKDMFEFWQHVISSVSDMYDAMDLSDIKSARSDAFGILFDVSDILEQKLSSSKEINEICVKFWKEAVLNTNLYDFYFASEYKEIAMQHIPMIIKYDPTYIPPKKKKRKTGGCFG